MKFKSIFFLSAAVLSLTACSDDDEIVDNGGDNIVYKALDCKALANSINTDFTNFCEENTAFEDKKQSTESQFVMNASTTISGKELHFVVKADKDIYGNVGSVVATLNNNDNALEAWKYFLNNATALDFGSFLGTKYRATTEGGVLQTVEESLQYVEDNSDENLLMCSVFGIVSGKAYGVPTLDNGAFSIQLMKNYLTLDYGQLGSWIGGDYQTFADEHYIIGNKMSLWGQNYIYIDYALDGAGNAFNVDVNGDTDSQYITSIRASLDYEKYDAPTQLAIWKSYAEGASDLGLGTFKSAYRKSAFGGTPEMFDGVADVVEYVETKGRPGGFDPDIIVEYENGAHTITITLKSLYTYVDIN